MKTIIFNKVKKATIGLFPLYLFAILPLLASCEDYLDVKPSTELDRSELFRSENGYVDALTGVYTQMASSSMYGRDLSIIIPDALDGTYSSNPQLQQWTKFAFKHDDPNRNENAIAAIDVIWGNMYNCIVNLNSLLGSIDDNKGVFSGDDYRIIKGEALGLHAFLHFELLRMFAPSYAVDPNAAVIPYSTEMSTDIQPLMPTKDIMKKLIEELTQARELMQNDPIHTGKSPNIHMAPLSSDPGMDEWHNRRFRFNYYAVVATLARVYLWQGDKEKALACAKEVIADQQRFPWVTSENLVNIGSNNQNDKNQDRLFATEHIFAMNVLQLESFLDGYTWLGHTTLTSLATTLSYDVYGSLFDGKDVRKQYLIEQSGWYYISTKYTQTTDVYNCYKARVPLIRISEMYYIAAECEPDAAKALGYLEEVRSHRGLSDIPFSSGVDLQSEIAKEYRKEFVGEGQMWYYYKRTNAASIPNRSGFKTEYYTFDRPEKEDVYANR